MDGKAQLAAYFARQKGSQARVARECGCSQGHLSLVIKGERGLSVPLAKRISEATGVPVRALVADKIEKAEEAIEAAQ